MATSEVLEVESSTSSTANPVAAAHSRRRAGSTKKAAAQNSAPWASMAPRPFFSMNSPLQAPGNRVAMRP